MEHLVKITQFDGKKVSYLDTSHCLGEVVVQKGKQTQKYFARVCSLRKPSPPLRLVYSRNKGGRVVDQVWSADRA